MLRLCTKVTVSPTVGAAQVVGHLGHGAHLGPAGGEEGHDLVLADLLAERDAVQDLGHRAARRRRARSGR